MKKFSRIVVVALALALFTGCITTKQAINDTPGNDPEPLASMIFNSKPGAVHCRFEKHIEASRVDIHCSGTFGDLKVNFDDWDQPKHQALEYTFMGQHIIYHDWHPKVRPDGKAVIMIDQVTIIDDDSGMTRERMPVIADQHLFDRWRTLFYEHEFDDLPVVKQ